MIFDIQAISEFLGQLSYSCFVYVLLGIFVFAFLIQEFYYFYYYRGFLRYSNKVKRSMVGFSYHKPSVSVVICARNESENIKKNLEGILQQEYPNYEVIVVNDGSNDDTNDILYLLEKKYPHLYHTFLPEEAKFVSRKKMALTVGIKAAKGEILLLTDADCWVESKYWIENMVRNFDNETDLVLGYGAYSQKKGMLGRMISFDTFFIMLQYYGFALRGCPYMGVGRNMAYRKSRFVANKGFASLMNIQSGDDDLFVEQISTPKNTKVEVSLESVTYSEPKATFYEWYVQKYRHLTTAAYYKTDIRFRIGVEVFSRFLFYLSLILLLIFGDMFLRCCVLSVFLSRFLTQLIILNRSAKHMKERRFHLDILLFDIFLPLVNLYAFTLGRQPNSQNYKWK